MSQRRLELKMPSRSLFPTVVVALLLVTAGCQGGTTSTPTATVEPTTATLSPPTTHASITTTGSSDPVFNASISFPSCTAVTVDAEEYRWVGVVTPERVYEYNETMHDRNTFETNAPVEFVLVYGSGDGRERVVNPGYEACIEARQTTEAPTPTPTPTATPTTVATTTQTPTPTTVVTTQTTTYHTHTTQTTTREPLREYRITTHVMNESLDAGYSRVRVKNWHEGAVRLDYDVVWERDRDITENVDRHELVLDPGESVVLESRYTGNGSAYAVEYKVNNLEYTDD